MNRLTKGMVYSRSGVGKTVLLASALEVPELCPILYMNTENRVESIEGKYHSLQDIKSPVVDKLNMVNVNSIEDCFKWYQKLMLNKTLYKSWFIDSGTMLNYVTVKGPFSSSEVIDFTTISKGTYDDYYNSLHKTMALFEALKKSPFHVWVTALTRPIKAEGIQQIYPDFSPESLPEKVVSMLDYVFYMNGGITSRSLIFQPDGVHSAKDCSSKLGRTMDSPTMKKIMDKLR